MPEGDSLHRAAQILYPKLVGERLDSLMLVRSNARTEGLIGNLGIGQQAPSLRILRPQTRALSVEAHAGQHRAM